MDAASGTLTPLTVRVVHHELLPARELALTPRKRFVEYQADLHRISGVELDAESLTRGDQYTYVDLADTMLARTGREVLAGIDVLVTSYWTPEFDPDISAFGPYLHHRYALGCQSFDVIDRGSISPVLALSVLAEYLDADPDATHGALIGVEQSTVPLPVGARFPTPSRSSAGLIRLGHAVRGGGREDGASTGAEVVATMNIGEAQALTSEPDLGTMVTRWCREFRIEPGQVTVAIRRDTFLYRKASYLHGFGPWGFQVQFLPSEHSCMELFRWLTALVAQPGSEERYVAFVDEDIESLAAAAVLVRLGEPK